MNCFKGVRLERRRLEDREHTLNKQGIISRVERPSEGSILFIFLNLVEFEVLGLLLINECSILKKLKIRDQELRCASANCAGRTDHEDVILKNSAVGIHL